MDFFNNFTECRKNSLKWFMGGRNDSLRALSDKLGIQAKKKLKEM